MQMLRQSWQHRGSVLTVLALCIGTACEQAQAPSGAEGSNANGGTTAQSTNSLRPGAGGGGPGPSSTGTRTPISAGGTGSPGMATGRGAGGVASVAGGAGMAGADRTSGAGGATRGEDTDRTNPVDPGGGAR
jgi:hypothetical protein